MAGPRFSVVAWNVGLFRLGEARAILFPLSTASYRRLFFVIAAGAVVLALFVLALPTAEAQCVPGRPLTPRVDSDRTTTITVHLAGAER